jgi:hypothetical protein
MLQMHIPAMKIAHSVDRDHSDLIFYWVQNHLT